MAIKNRRFLARASRTTKSFLDNRKGGVAVTFALAFPAVAFLSLVAVDYSRASSGRQALQETLDAAALIVARSNAGADLVDEVGDAAFHAQVSNEKSLLGFKPDGDGAIKNVTFTLDGNKITGVANGEVEPLVASAFIDGNLDISATSEVLRPINKLEIALVLDTTGSMQGTKLTNLIAAAKNFVDLMEAAAETSTQSNPIKISVVPFAQTVRVQDPLSMATYNTTNFSMTNLPTWLDGRNRAVAYNNDIFANANATEASRIDRFRMLKNINKPWGGCVEARVAPYDIRDTAPSASTVQTLFAPYFWPDEFDDGSSNANYLNDYLADVTTSTTSPTWKTRQSYSQKYVSTNPWKPAANATFIPNAAYGAGWQYGPNAACNMQKIRGLSTDWSEIRTHINGLVASGETNIPMGLMWGWHTISPHGPIGTGVAYDTPNHKKIIVLMTDGDNTMNDTISSSNGNNSYYHGYGYIWQTKIAGTTATSDTATRTAKMDARLVPPANNPGAESLCGNLRTQGIEVYTVGVGVSQNAQTLLTKCAYQPDYFYNVDAQGTNLSAAFAAIAGRLDNLRIYK